MLKNLSKHYVSINNKKGFTLVELVVVIAIMAILALIIVPNLTAYTDKAEVAKIDTNLKNLHTAAEMVVQTTPDLGENDIDLVFGDIATYSDIPEDKIYHDWGLDKYDVYWKDYSTDSGAIEVSYIDDGGVLYKYDGTRFTDSDNP